MPFFLHKGDDVAHLGRFQCLDCRHDLVKGDFSYGNFTFKAVSDNTGKFGKIFF